MPFTISFFRFLTSRMFFSMSIYVLGTNQIFYTLQTNIFSNFKIIINILKLPFASPICLFREQSLNSVSLFFTLIVNLLQEV